MLSWEQWDSRAKHAHDEDPDPHYADAIPYLESPTGLSVVKLAALSLRICPADNAYNYAAIGLLAEGKEREATTALLKTLNAPLARPIARATTINLALCYSQLNDYQKAIDCLRIARHLDASDPEILLDLALNALLLDDHNEFLWATSMLASFATELDSYLLDFLRLHELRSRLPCLTRQQRRKATAECQLIRRITDAVSR
jgi:tetratricopeptide (TPR) repeat protein